MKLSIFSGVIALLLFVAGPALQEANASTEPTPVLRKATTSSFTVEIELVNYYTGQPVTNHGLRGFWAQNHATGEYYYSDRDDLLTDLPAGTYTIGAFNGYWDGAVSKVVTLDESSEEDYVVVTLSYWVE